MLSTLLDVFLLALVRRVLDLIQIFINDSDFLNCPQGVETVDSSHFITPNNIERLNQAKEAKRVEVW